MDGLAALLHGFSVAITAHHIILMMVGVLLGILVFMQQHFWPWMIPPY